MLAAVGVSARPWKTVRIPDWNGFEIHENANFPQRQQETALKNSSEFHYLEGKNWISALVRAVQVKTNHFE